MKVGFVLYQNDKFFQSRRFATPLGTTRNVITGSISSDSAGLGKTVPEFVELLYQPPVGVVITLIWSLELSAYNNMVNSYTKSFYMCLHELAPLL